jgi:hypothetical protein
VSQWLHNGVMKYPEHTGPTRPKSKLTCLLLLAFASSVPGCQSVPQTLAKTSAPSGELEIQFFGFGPRRDNFAGALGQWVSLDSNQNFIMLDLGFTNNSAASLKVSLADLELEPAEPGSSTEKRKDVPVRWCCGDGGGQRFKVGFLGGLFAFPSQEPTLGPGEQILRTIGLLYPKDRTPQKLISRRWKLEIPLQPPGANK